MCGISGYITDYSRSHPNILETLAHRGPDHAAFYLDHLYGQTIYLGHNRLSILDLSENGHQPMQSQDGLITLIYNGEVYNHEALRREFLRDRKFHSNTDTETILYLYEKFGIDCVNKLNGDFAIAILDKRHSKFYLVRDRFGVKPLYYAFTKGELIFGSEIKAILAVRDDSPINTKGVARYLVFKYSLGEETLFAGIKRLKPAHYLEYDLYTRKIRNESYWQVSSNTLYHNLSYADARQQLFDLLADATRIRLMADVPVGNFFSGGVDSSTIAYFIKDNTAITHYCARKNERAIREEGTTSDFQYAARLAGELKLNFHPIDIGDSELELSLIRQTLYYSDDLIADGSQIPSYLITREAAKTSKVLLSGMGADEVFLGYAGHLLALLSSRLDSLPLLSNAAAKWLRKVEQGNGYFKAYRRYLHKLGKYHRYPRFKYGLFAIVGDFENALSVYPTDEENVADYIASYFPDDQDVFECIHQFEFENFLVKNLHYLDRLCMANSTEGRVPFLDHRIVEFAYSLPRQYKLTNLGASKKILKDAMRPYLPSYVLDRRKAGFGMPLRSLFSTPAKVWSLLDKDFFGNLDGFSVPNIERIVENHVYGREDNSTLIYALISFQEWYKMFFDRESSSSPSAQHIEVPALVLG